MSFRCAFELPRDDYLLFRHDGEKYPKQTAKQKASEIAADF